MRQQITLSKSLRNRLRRFIMNHALIAENDRVLAGISGGPDSTCLLIVLAALRRSLKFDLYAAHFDHQLRGNRASARELKVVQALADTLDVPLKSGAGDVRAYARGQKRSLEEAARELRYEFLRAQALELGCNVVALGHTQDDQAETVLLHLIRGSGLRGIAAMAPRSPWPFPNSHRPRLVRPILEMRREETVQVCCGAGLETVDDPTNRSDANTRARIRRDVIPLLRELNPQVDSALARIASAAGDDVTLLEEIAEGLVESSSAGEARIDRKGLNGSPPAIRRHAVRLAAARALGDAKNISERHIHNVLTVASGPTGSTTNLARGLRVVAKRRHIVFSTPPVRPRKQTQTRPKPLQPQQTTVFGHWKVAAADLQRRPKDVKSPNPLSVVVDAEACGKDLRVRFRRNGDRFQPLGMASAKKLQDFFVDAHVPREERDDTPLVVSDRGIVWVVGQRPADWAKVTDSTKRYLRIRAHA